MLKQLRSGRTMKTVMGTMALVFIVGFVFLGDFRGGGSRGRASQSNVVAVINGQEIPYEAFSRRVSQMAETERNRVERSELSSTDYERIEAQAWEGLVSEVLVNQEAQRLRLHASDEEIVATLTRNPPDYIRQRFQDDKGQFDPAKFEQALNDPSYPWEQDESYIRSLLPTIKLRQMVYARATVSEPEVREEYARRTLRSTVKYVGRRWSDIDLGSWTPSPDEVRRAYDAHPLLFARGEQVALEALRIEKKASATDREELVNEARGMIKELDTKDFASLAQVYSDDPSSSNGGLMGWVRRNALPEPVAAAAWGLAPGGHTEPLATDRGVYVVHADSVRTAKDGEREMYLRQLYLKLEPSPDTQDSLRTLAHDLAAAAEKNFDEAGKKYGIAPQKLEPFELSDFVPGIGYAPRLHEWAAKAKPGDVGGPFGNDTAILMLRLVERRPAGPQPFEQVEARARTLCTEEHRKEMARAALQTVADAVHRGATLEQAAASAHLEVKSPPPFTDYEGTPETGSANEFTAVAGVLPVGQTSGVVETTMGAYVVHVIARDPFDPTRYQSERDAYYQSLISRRADGLFAAWLKELRDHAKIIDHRQPRV
jgi:parvulin-like peptidyl-prolyl isomerase